MCVAFRNLVGLLRSGWIDEVRLIPQEEVLRNILSINGLALEGQCLNVGCGEGLYVNFLNFYPRIKLIVNLDLNLKLLRHSIERGVCGSIIHLPFRDESFDCCLATEVIEHIDNDEKAIGEIFRVLRPAGLLLVSVPTPPAPFDIAHVRQGYTLDDFTALVTKGGFIIQCYRYCLHFWMRFFYGLWQWQFRVIGKSRRSWLPRFVGLFFGNADKYFKVGKPWDLIVLARKKSNT